MTGFRVREFEPCAAQEVAPVQPMSCYGLPHDWLREGTFAASSTGSFVVDTEGHVLPE
jgi:hypothetical protein